MKSDLMHIDQEYLDWIAELCQRYRLSQIKAAVSVNSYMLRFYWSIGQDISRRSLENRYGSHFYERVGVDLRKALNLNKGFSATTVISVGRNLPVFFSSVKYPSLKSE